MRVLRRGPKYLTRLPSEYLKLVWLDIVSPLPLAMRYPMVGAFGALIYAMAMIAIWFAPDTSGKNLED